MHQMLADATGIGVHSSSRRQRQTVRSVQRAGREDGLKAAAARLPAGLRWPRRARAACAPGRGLCHRGGREGAGGHGLAAVADAPSDCGSRYVPLPVEVVGSRDARCGSNLSCGVHMCVLQIRRTSTPRISPGMATWQRPRPSYPIVCTCCSEANCENLTNNKQI